MKATIWTKDDCTFCTQAKKLLEAKEIEYTEQKIGEEFTKEQLLEAVPGAKSVPQIFIDGEYVGGYRELVSRFVQLT